MIYCCENCGELVDEQDVEKVKVQEQTWTSPAEWEWRCPYCKADYDSLEEANRCELCGAPISPFSAEIFCRDCKEDMEYRLGYIVQSMSDEWSIPKKTVEDCFIEYIAQR